MNNLEIIKKIKNSINSGEEIAPVLFMGSDLSKVHFEINEIILKLFEDFNVDKNNIFSLIDDGSNIKIEEIKVFIAKSFIKSNFKFQIFYIENISRLTIKASNSMLKFLEEPGVGNIILLSNSGENNILDTIISRVQILNIEAKKISTKNLTYYEMIDDYILNNDIRIFTYFYNEKLETLDYKNFLINFLLYIKENISKLDNTVIDLIGEIEESITGIEKNNLLAKYQVDKILLKMK